MTPENDIAYGRLPPHSPEAERGVLACCLEDPSCFEQAEKSIADETWFYDLRHQTIWLVMRALFQAAVVINWTSVHQRLVDFKNVDAAGGMPYTVDLINATPSASMLGSFVETLREKHVARRLVQTCVRAVNAVHEMEGLCGETLDKTRLALDELEIIKRASDAHPARVKKPFDYAEDHWNLWFGERAGEPGINLPWGLPWKIRESELTLILGENGAGKSTFFSYTILHLLAHPETRVLIASMETQPEITLKIMASQLIGASTLDNTDANSKRVARALEWLNQRVLVYDFLGIVHWKTLLQTMGYCSEHLGVNVVLIDSLMRLGIMDDDYAQQGDMMKSLANFSLKHRAHTFLVNHLNKSSDRDTKARNRGSGQIPDNAFNIVSIQRNEKKWSKLDEIRDACDAGEISDEDARQQRAKLSTEWDAQLGLHKQRWAGSRQNGAKRLWFMPQSLQYADTPHAQPVDWLEHFTAHPRTKTLRIGKAAAGGVQT